jgi:hypothetical protein
MPANKVISYEDWLKARLKVPGRTAGMTPMLLGT